MHLLIAMSPMIRNNMNKNNFLSHDFLRYKKLNSYPFEVMPLKSACQKVTE